MVRYSSKSTVNLNQHVIDPITTNVRPAPPHNRHPNSNPLLVLYVLRRILSTNAANTYPFLWTKNFKKSKISNFATIVWAIPTWKTTDPPNCDANNPNVELPTTRLSTLNSEKTSKKIPRLINIQFVANPIYILTTKIQERQRNFNARRFKKILPTSTI